MSLCAIAVDSLFVFVFGMCEKRGERLAVLTKKKFFFFLCFKGQRRFPLASFGVLRQRKSDEGFVWKR